MDFVFQIYGHTIYIVYKLSKLDTLLLSKTNKQTGREGILKYVELLMTSLFMSSMMINLRI